MLNFLYDSLDTVKNLKFPTQKEFINLIIWVFVLVIISGILFVFYDTIFDWFYKTIYSTIRG